MDKIQSWLIAEKESIIEFQKNSWEQGKMQLAENGQQISELFEKVSNFFTGSVM
jgi:hypothetical protein